MIGFTLTNEQKTLRKGAVDIAKEILAPARDVYSAHPDQQTRFRSTLPIFQKLVKAGWRKLVRGWECLLVRRGTTLSSMERR